MFYAHAVNVRTEVDTARTFPTAELAARHVVLLMRLDEWKQDPDETVARLVAGETLTHKRFAYRVSDKP